MNEQHGQTTGKLSLTAFMTQIHQLFPSKSKEALLKLHQAVLIDSKGTQVDYVSLLAEDREGNQSTFCECLRGQHLDQVMQDTTLCQVPMQMLLSFTARVERVTLSNACIH